MSSAEQLARLADRLAARRAHAFTGESDRRWAAVGAILRPVDATSLDLLVIRRPLKAGDPWSGHMALPGGRRDPRDVDLEATMVRETREEVGLDLVQHGRVLGALDDLAPRNPALPPIVVRPFVAVLESPAPVVPNDEVAAWYWVPLAQLASPSAAVEHTIAVTDGPGGQLPTAFAHDAPADAVRMRFPAFQFEGEVIWGLTERVIRQLLTLL